MTPSHIPLGDLQREYERLRSEIDQAIERVLRRGWFILGEEVAAFEQEWATYCGVAHAAGVGNGTDAIQLALRASGIGPGDEVVIPALTTGFTALAVSLAGATPVFADVEPTCLTLDPAAFEAAITPRTAAVLPVHLYGCPAEMDPIVEIGRQHGLLVLEDASQAHGAHYRERRAGGLGDVAAFSFYPTKNLGAYGDAGAVVTDDEVLASKVRILRDGGRRQSHVHESLGTNSRLDEMQAAILRVKLPHLAGWNKRRQALAARYDTGLRGIEGLTLPAAPEHIENVYYLYVVRTSLRATLREYLAGAGIHTGIHYRQAVHLQEAFAHLGYRPGAFPVAERATMQVLSLPLFAHLSDHELAKVTRLVRFFFAMR